MLKTRSYILKLKILLALFLGFLLLFPPQVAQALISLEEEDKIGKEVLFELTKEVEFIDDLELNLYINAIGEELKKKGLTFSPFDFKFFLINNPSFNAFSVPGGYIFINSGIFNSIESEDELAGIMAHEMAHNLGRHIARRIEDIKKMQVLVTAATLAGIILGGEKAAALSLSSMAIAQTRLLAYSRADEEEADRTGFQILTKAGYNPWGMATVMERLSKKGNLAIELEYRYLLTHPLPQERVAYLISLAERYTTDRSPKNLIAEDPNYFKRLLVKAQVFSKKKDLASLITNLKVELSQKEDPWTRYTLALALKEQRYFKDALVELVKALQGLPFKPYFLLDLADIYLTSGEYLQALNVLNQIPPITPSKPYETLYLTKLDYLKALALAETGEPQKAYKLMQKFLSLSSLSYDPYFFYNLGKLASQLNKMGEAHFYFAKHYQLKGDLKPALYHYEKALSFLPKTDKMYLEVEKAIAQIKHKK
ncbi:M48 family metalloprotease [Thermodesulfobacterium sp. TA1]|uniref:M48 family metalloprotease n=1 Tax=Thermodesulfobacterium sp. TA1 TaxID=2234087 RepID=UPI00143DF2BD|nr:M48 family metalloprotease [Thermodesulfobacterium sp. TA1]